MGSRGMPNSADSTAANAPACEELSLGDILAAALTGLTLEERREEEEERLASRANLLSAYRLSDELAPLLGVAPGEVFDALTDVPDNMLGLLCTPEGWSMLAEFVAGRLNIASPAYRPTLH